MVGAPFYFMEEDMKGYKTILASLAVILIGVLEQFDIAQFIPDEFDGLAVAVIGVIMAGLRMVTTTPVGTKE